MSGRKWFGIALFNLLVLSLMGVILRYKIAYYLPFPDQKHLLFSHSHFAFTGWVTTAILTLHLSILSRIKQKDLFPKYKNVLVVNLISAWGMLVSFIYQGYGAISIGFSTLSILVIFYYAILMRRELKTIHHFTVSTLLFKAAIIFNILSSVGAFALAFMMATHAIHQHMYLAAVYFFLHFQYNGWFILSCFGAGFYFLQVQNINSRHFKSIAWMSILAVGPSYFLSTLWMPLPNLVYVIVVLAALSQLSAWIWLLTLLKKKALELYQSGKPIIKWLIALVFIAYTAKVLLQAGSTIPSLSTIAFGFRPIVIGYLHLVLLGVVTLFLICCIILLQQGHNSRYVIKGVYLFSSGIIINEFLLMIQGGAAMGYIVIPFTNEALLVAAFTMFSGLFMIHRGYHKIHLPD